MPIPKTMDLLSTPPVECSFKLNDEVMFTNDYGVVFGPYLVTGFASELCNGRFIHLNKDSYWFPVRPDSLTLVKSRQELSQNELVFIDRMAYYINNQGATFDEAAKLVLEADKQLLDAIANEVKKPRNKRVITNGLSDQIWKSVNQSSEYILKRETENIIEEQTLRRELELKRLGANFNINYHIHW